jgi:hypothetical protein
MPENDREEWNYKNGPEAHKSTGAEKEEVRIFA